MNTDKFVRKPFYVEAVRVTDANLEDVAKWCKGEVLEEEGRRYIKVDVHMPMNDRQTKAFSGDWVLYANKGYKVYQNKSFWASFDKCEQAEKDAIEKLAAKTNHGRHDKAKTTVNPALMKQQMDRQVANQQKVSRSAKTGEFVSKEAAEANPDMTVTETVKTAAVKTSAESLASIHAQLEQDTPIPDVDEQVTTTELPADASLA